MTRSPSGSVAACFGALWLCIATAGAATVGTTPSSSLSTGSWAMITETADGEFAITYKKTEVDLTVTPSQYLDDGMWFFNRNPGPQSPSEIQALIIQKYNIVPPATISYVSGCNSSMGTTTSSGATSTTAASYTKAAGSTGTFGSSQGFDYLAVHLGKGELIFHWSQPITLFTISGDNGFSAESVSNYRAYMSSLVVTPLPGALILFASGLGLLGIARRAFRKSA